MFYKNYDVQIVRANGLPFPEFDQKVSISHGDNYAIQVASFYDVRSEVVFSIDGKELDTHFVLEPSGTMTLKTPTNNGQMFKAFLPDSAEGVELGLDDVSKRELGLITVKLYPERKRTIEPLDSYARPKSVSRGAGGQSLGIGDNYSSNMESSYRGAAGASASAKSIGMGTGLEGESGQRFRTVAPIIRSGVEVVIHLRLVAATQRYETNIPY